MLKFLKRSAQGASVPHEKATSEMATVQMPVPKNVVIPMSMHIGAPAQPVVKKGDQVYVGTLIGQAGGFVSANIHSSVSGTVVGVAPMRMVNGAVCQAVAIESDGQQTVDPACQPPVVNDKDSLLQAVQACGLVGVGGAGFPTHVKLAAEVDTLLINAAECEPYLTTDAREMLECSDTILGGIRAVMQYCGIPRCIIGIERNKPACIDLMCSLTRDVKGVSVKPLPMRYPQGAEKQLIYAITGREVPSGGLPAAVGCAVFNAATCKAIHDEVYDGMPLISRIVTVSGDIIMEPKNLLVPIGTAFNDLLEACGHSENPYKVLSGGPMMGMAQYDLNVPTIKGVNAVTVLGKRNEFAVEEPHCLRCGKCIEACPMKLMPVLMYKAIQSGDVEDMKANNIMDCIECGCCAYTCPASVPLVLGFRVGKQHIRNAAAAAKK